MAENIKGVIGEGGLAKYRLWVERLIDEDYNTLDVAAALLKLKLGLEEDVENYGDLADTGGAPGMARLFINVGRKEGITAGDIVGAIAGETGLPGKIIGTIDIYDRFTFVEVPTEHASEVLSTMKNNQIKGRKINIEPANEK